MDFSRSADGIAQLLSTYEPAGRHYPVYGLWCRESSHSRTSIFAGHLGRELNARDPEDASQRISGGILLPVPTMLSGAMVVVRLLDVTLIDVPARVIAEVAFPFSGGPVGRIPFELQLDEPITDSTQVTLSAEIRAKGTQALKIGDWLTTRSYGVSPAAIQAGAPIDLVVEQIKG